MINGKNITEENRYLKNTISKINTLLYSYLAESELQDKELIKHRKYLWDNRSEFDEIEVNENCSHVALNEQIQSKKLSRIRSLEKQLQTPYFARLDFREDDENSADSFYIGLSTIEDEENFDILVFDWRSPVASMFYDFEVGKAYYDAPARRISGEIEFSRQFNIRNGEIVFMHNSNDNLCDDALNTILSNNATDKMKNIIASIQKEQNSIIRNDDSKVLFIQGAAGSGKTSIALHRSAYLLYKHRKELTADNILIFSPNEVFAEYISDVLPDLGETNIKQTTFELFANKFLPQNILYENKNDHLEYIYSHKTSTPEFKLRSKSMEYKNSLEFMEILNEFILCVPSLITDIKPIFIDGKQIVTKKIVEKTFNERFKDIPFLNRIEVIKNSLLSQVENRYLSDQDDSEFDYVEDRKTFYDYCNEEVSNQVNNMIKTTNPLDIYKLLWNNIDKYNKNINDIKKISLENLEDFEIKYEDITPIIYIRAALEGFRSYGNIKHILIDEAQDYSPLFYELIKKSFPNASITIMGDLNQRIDIHSNVKDRTSITNIFNDVKTVTLTKSYRSTYDITTFTKDILDTHEPIEAVDRFGIKPTVYQINTNLKDKITLKIKELINKDYKSIALIGKNKLNCEKIYEELLPIFNDEINLITNDKCDFEIGINVITSYLAKGLEFDAVIVIDGEEYLYLEDKHLFYTVCTRALHELHIYTLEDISSTVLPSNSELYNYVRE